LREFDLEAIAVQRLGAFQQALRGGTALRVIERPAVQDSFRLRAPPRLVRTPPNAMRASRTTPPSMSSAAATDTRANA